MKNDDQLKDDVDHRRHIQVGVDLLGLPRAAIANRVDRAKLSAGRQAVAKLGAGRRHGARRWRR